MARTVTFLDYCKYDLHNVNQYDINKLFGVSHGFHHKNSARFGWRWDTKKGKMEILAYVYSDGKRIRESQESLHVCYVYPGIGNDYSIDVTEDEYIFRVDQYELRIKHGKLPFWGYYLNLYFGGDETAPHDMIVLMDKL